MIAGDLLVLYQDYKMRTHRANNVCDQGHRPREGGGNSSIRDS